ncbi:hypothetical protein [Streptomyces sp. NPDC059080]|uniref:hypothetical protein n=1 Tax=Streptomyces sp. NPDC059080 TaxID=3346718 RepID=UPI0036B80C4B
MDWPAYLAYGAAGGAIVEAVVFYGRVSTWQAARHRVLAKGRGRLPPLRRYIDLPSDLLAAATRLLLGAAAGWLFHSQITGVYAAVAVGASAPAMLRQVGAAKSVRGLVGPSSGEPAERQQPPGGPAAGDAATPPPGAVLGLESAGGQWGEGAG